MPLDFEVFHKLSKLSSSSLILIFGILLTRFLACFNGQEICRQCFDFHEHRVVFPIYLPQLSFCIRRIQNGVFFLFPQAHNFVYELFYPLQILIEGTSNMIFLSSTNFAILLFRIQQTTTTQTQQLHTHTHTCLLYTSCNKLNLCSFLMRFPRH